MSTTIAGLAEARAVLGDSVLGPEELAAALGFDPLSLLTADERAAIDPLPFDSAALASARAENELLVLRIARDPDGPLTMLQLEKRLGGLAPQVHRGVGYLLRDEWTIDGQPFAVRDTPVTGWYLVRRSPHPATLNRSYRAQDAALRTLAGRRSGIGARRSAVEAAFDLLCWYRHSGQRLLAAAFDWTHSRSSDGGFVAVGGFGPSGLEILAFSAAVRFGSLGVCVQR